MKVLCMQELVCDQKRSFVVMVCTDRLARPGSAEHAGLQCTNSLDISCQKAAAMLSWQLVRHNLHLDLSEVDCNVSRRSQACSSIL